MPESKSGALPLGDSPRESVASAISGRCEPPQRVSVERPRHKSREAAGARRPGQYLRGCILGGERREYARTRPRHARFHRRRRRCCLASERFETSRDFRKSRGRNRLQIVAAKPLRKEKYFRGGAISCQFGGGENRRCRHCGIGCEYHEPSRRQAHRGEQFADPASKRRLSENKERHVRPELERKAHQHASRITQLPEPIEPEQNCGGIRAAAAEACSHRKLLPYRQADASIDATGLLHEARGPDREIILGCHTCQTLLANDRTVASLGKRDRVGARDRNEESLERVISVRTPARHVQKRVELGRRRQRQGPPHAHCQESTASRSSTSG